MKLTELDNPYKDPDMAILVKEYGVKKIAKYIVDNLDPETAHIREDELYVFLLKKYLPKAVYNDIDPLLNEPDKCRWYA